MWGWIEKAQDIALQAQEQAAIIALQATERAAVLKQTVQAQVYGAPDNVATAASDNGTAASTTASSSPTALLDICYVTENTLAMAFPCDMQERTKDKKASQPSVGNDINAVSAFLRDKHRGRYMIWNISEEGYDYSKFQDQVSQIRSLLYLLFLF